VDVWDDSQTICGPGAEDLSEGSKRQNASVRRIGREHGLPPSLLYTPPITKRLSPDRENMPSAIHLSLIGLTDLERNPMSTFAQRVTVPRNSQPLAQASKSYFLLGQNERGLWVIRENMGTKAGVFLSREAAMRFARHESPQEHFAVVYVPDGLEFDYAA
jgi:hypothetical protein